MFCILQVEKLLAPGRWRLVDIKDLGLFVSCEHQYASLDSCSMSLSVKTGLNAFKVVLVIIFLAKSSTLRTRNCVIVAISFC